jgi:predicted metalloprotease with PDZ domain
MAAAELAASSSAILKERPDEDLQTASTFGRPGLIHAIVFLKPTVGYCGKPKHGIRFGIRNGFLAITKIAESSPFRYTALKPGDHVLQINGTRCSPFDEAKALEYTVRWANEQLYRTNAVVSISAIPEGQHSDLVSTTLVNAHYAIERYERNDPTWMGVELQKNEGEAHLSIGSVHINSPLALYASIWAGDQCMLVNGQLCRWWAPTKAAQLLRNNPTKSQATKEDCDVDRFVTLHTKTSAANLENYLRKQNHSTARSTSGNRGSGGNGEGFIGCLHCLVAGLGCLVLLGK